MESLKVLTRELGYGQDTDGVAAERVWGSGVPVGSAWAVADGVGSRVAVAGVSSASVTAAPWQAASSQLSGMIRVKNLLSI